MTSKNGLNLHTPCFHCVNIRQNTPFRRNSGALTPACVTSPEWKILSSLLQHWKIDKICRSASPMWTLFANSFRGTFFTWKWGFSKFVPIFPISPSLQVIRAYIWGVVRVRHIDKVYVVMQRISLPTLCMCICMYMVSLRLSYQLRNSLLRPCRAMLWVVRSVGV